MNYSVGQMRSILRTDAPSLRMAVRAVTLRLYIRAKRGLHGTQGKREAVTVFVAAALYAAAMVTIAQMAPASSNIDAGARGFLAHVQDWADPKWPAGLPEVPETLAQTVSDVTPELLNELRAEEKCLAQAVYFEARSESLEGQLAVAQVVLNRVRDKRYPSNICGVVFQGETKRHRCQFSFACDGLSDRPRNRAAWQTARAISHIALQDYWDVLVGDSTHYHADYVSPYWSGRLDRIVAVDRHIFYRDTSF